MAEEFAAQIAAILAALRIPFGPQGAARRMQRGS
jgi:hypothetical protein